MLLMYVLAALFALPSCGSSESQVTEQENKNTIETVTDTVTTIPADSATFYSEVVNKKNCFIVISKPEYRLYVCEVVNGDTLKRVHYPVCVGKNKGQKQKPGDMKTPECTGLVHAFEDTRPYGHRHPWQHQQREFGAGTWQRRMHPIAQRRLERVESQICFCWNASGHPR